MKYISTVLVLMFWAPVALGQSSWPAGKVKFSNGEWLQDKRDEHPFYAQDALPTCASPTWGLTIYISDGSDASDCAVGTPGTVTAACFCDDNDTWTSHNSGGGGGGTPGGSDTQVQYNDGGAFGGDAGFTYDGTDLTVGSLLLGDGSAADPAFSFAAENTTGFFRYGVNSMGVSLGGVGRYYFTSGYLQTEPVRPNNTAGSTEPQYSFLADPDTGFWLDYLAVAEIKAVIGGTVEGYWASDGLHLTDTLFGLVDIGSGSFSTASGAIAAADFDTLFDNDASDDDANGLHNHATEIAGGISTHAALADAHREHASLEESSEIDSDIATHASVSAAHHNQPTVNSASVTAPNLADTVAVQIVQCTGSGTPHLLCASADDVIGVIPKVHSHTHLTTDIQPIQACTDTTPADGLCDHDGITPLRVACADSKDTPIPVAKGGPGGAQTSCANPDVTWCGDGYCDAFPQYMTSNTVKEHYNQIVKDSFTSDTGGSNIPYWIQHFVKDGASGVAEGVRIELDVEDLDVNDLTDEITDPNATGAALKVSVTPSTINFPYPNIIVTRNESNPAHVGAAFRHYVTKIAGVTDNAFDASHGAIDVALAMGDNNLTTQCTDRFDDGGPPQVSCVGGASNYDDIIGCPDTFCDIDGSTTAPDLETFTHTDIETVLLGASKDNADAQHSHTLPPACAYIEDPVSAEVFESVWRAPAAVTVTEIWCETDAGTVGLDLDIDNGTPAGINGSDISCASTGTADSSFAGSAALADGDRLDINLGTVATATRLSVCWEYTVD